VPRGRADRPHVPFRQPRVVHQAGGRAPQLRQVQRQGRGVAERQEVLRVTGRKDQWGEVEEFICNTCRFEKKETQLTGPLKGPRKIDRHSVISQGHYERKLKQKLLDTAARPTCRDRNAKNSRSTDDHHRIFLLVLLRDHPDRGGVRPMASAKWRPSCRTASAPTARVPSVAAALGRRRKMFMKEDFVPATRQPQALLHGSGHRHDNGPAHRRGDPLGRHADHLRRCKPSTCKARTRRSASSTCSPW
jgi:hypothetical protein